MIENASVEQVGTPTDPEHDLLVKMLKQAVEDYKNPRGNIRKRKRLREEAREWFAHDSVDEFGDPWPFSFTNVCEALNLDPQAIRDRLKIQQGVSETGEAHNLVRVGSTPTPVTKR